MKHECLRRVCAILAAAVMTASSALAAEAVVDTSALILRKSASKTSKALQTLSEGDKMDILAVTGEWYKVRYGKYTGYVMSKYVDVKGELPKESASSSSDSTSSTTLRPGATGSAVKTLQTALKNQGYY
ncbi:MAG: SH3 domain-containing protein, partial [Clostridia bacterium]|nr:SH3 domain-containing protein [Clostridia bacterium]